MTYSADATIATDATTVANADSDDAEDNAAELIPPETQDQRVHLLQTLSDAEQVLNANLSKLGGTLKQQSNISSALADLDRVKLKIGNAYVINALFLGWFGAWRLDAWPSLGFYVDLLLHRILFFGQLICG